MQCAGLISTRAYEGCELETLNKHAIRGAHIHAPGGRVLRIDGNRIMAYVVDRGELDRAMALEALKSGVSSLVKTRFSGLRRKGTQLFVTAISHGEPIEIQTSVLIGADGLQSTVGRLAGLDRVQSVLTCAQAEVYIDIATPDFVELYVGQDVAPSFFAWAIPTEWGTVRIGLCSSERSIELLNSLIEPHFSALCSLIGAVFGRSHTDRSTCVYSHRRYINRRRCCRPSQADKRRRDLSWNAMRKNSRESSRTSGDAGRHFKESSYGVRQAVAI